MFSNLFPSAVIRKEKKPFMLGLPTVMKVATFTFFSLFKKKRNGTDLNFLSRPNEARKIEKLSLNLLKTDVFEISLTLKRKGNSREF